ncbi:hypothetical protein EYF80_055986 [Liparis tanakae]|uniref:Transmembrane protein n=1 Tax=Liparis tanakae TaxID=230148 RepID=A0A4Z2EZ91_9TELE|nr:hypothetical protein EYF80_055986 [Liparis tanakae]
MRGNRPGWAGSAPRKLRSGGRSGSPARILVWTSVSRESLHRGAVLELEDSAPPAAGRAALQDHGAGGPGPGVQAEDTPEEATDHRPPTTDDHRPRTTDHRLLSARRSHEELSEPDGDDTSAFTHYPQSIAMWRNSSIEGKQSKRSRKGRNALRRGKGQRGRGYAQAPPPTCQSSTFRDSLNSSRGAFHSPTLTCRYATALDLTRRLRTSSIRSLRYWISRLIDSAFSASSPFLFSSSSHSEPSRSCSTRFFCRYRVAAVLFCSIFFSFFSTLGAPDTHLTRGGGVLAEGEGGPEEDWGLE